MYYFCFLGPYVGNGGHALLAITYICDFLFLLDIFITLRVSITTPHGQYKPLP